MRFFVVGLQKIANHSRKSQSQIAHMRVFPLKKMTQQSQITVANRVHECHRTPLKVMIAFLSFCI